MTKCYSELIALPTFEARFNYLYVGSKVGNPTFAAERYLNQSFYNSWEWKHIIRPRIITRDSGRDMALKGYDIFGRVILHHINPITIQDIEEMTPAVTDPENIVCVSNETHNAIHFSNKDGFLGEFVERKPNDTCPWRNTRNG